jgi:hypothetical protein
MEAMPDSTLSPGEIWGLVGIWKIASSQEFEQHQRQRLGE